jgi:small nuclear ribonucleoprotein E
MACFISFSAKKKTRVRIWLYEDTRIQMEGVIIGFDEYMNIVLDDAIEINNATSNTQQQSSKRINVGRCLLKGDSITLIQ